MASPLSWTVFAGVWLHGDIPHGCEPVDLVQCGLWLTSDRYNITAAVNDDEHSRCLGSDFMLSGQ